MTPRSAALGSVAFFVAAPVVVSGVVPWLVTRGSRLSSDGGSWSSAPPL